MNEAVQHVSADDFEKIIKGKNVLLLDVREKYEFKTGFIKGAKLAPATNFDEAFEGLKPKKNSTLALYCATGNRSAFIAEKLKKDGWKKIVNLELGIWDWREQGKKVVS